MTTRILLADDHRMLREGLKLILECRDDFSVAGESEDGPSALRSIQCLKPDVAIVAVRLKGLSGADVVSRVMLAKCDTRCLLMSGKPSKSDLEASLACGAHGYVSTYGLARELLEAVDFLSAGRHYFSPSASTLLADRAHRPEQNGRSAMQCLTSREREILQGVAEGLSTKEIALRVEISIRTVESHRAHLMDKLRIHKLTGLVRFAIREGLIEA